MMSRKFSYNRPYLLDSNIIIDLFGPKTPYQQKLRAMIDALIMSRYGGIYTCAIIKAEVLPSASKNVREIISRFLAQAEYLKLTENVDREFTSMITDATNNHAKPVADQLIAAIAKTYRICLLTSNAVDFEKIAGLELHVLTQEPAQ